MWKYQMPLHRVIPKSYPPTTLLEKDWATRACYVFNENENIAQMLTDNMHFLEVRHDDVWIVTLPKCGTTWMQELVWLVVNECNFEEAKSVPLELRSPFVELSFELLPSIGKAVQTLENMKSPRILKTHRPLPLMPQQVWSKKPKIIYVFRDPKDASVSKCHFGRLLGTIDDNTTLDEYIRNELQIERKSNCCFNHALEFYKLRHEPWVYYTSFENMKKDLRQEINRICKFLNKSVDDRKMEKLLKHLSFDEMQNNPQVNHQHEFNELSKVLHFDISYDRKFIRKGKVGSYKEELSPDVIKELDDWVEESLRPHNITLKDLLLQN